MLISFLFAIPYCYRKFKIVGTGGNAIELVIGDMLSDCNDMVIPSNNYYDTSWSIISRRSIQGQLAIKKYFTLRQLDKVIDEAIAKAGLNGTYNESKNMGKISNTLFIPLLQSKKMTELTLKDFIRLR